MAKIFQFLFGTEIGNGIILAIGLFMIWNVRREYESYRLNKNGYIIAFVVAALGAVLLISTFLKK
ncbi:MAG: hypothetical protein HRT71_01580 [Flavobacteriales bacterium]|nr:hypothetical protein [Flavobacteriales bacterium]